VTKSNADKQTQSQLSH